MLSDHSGDLLRQFYDALGAPDEGLPPWLNATETTPVAVSQADLDILSTALNDRVTRRQLRDCRALLEDLTARLASDQLVRELSGIPGVPYDLEQLSSGVLWFAMAASLDPRERDLPVTPLDGRTDLPLALKVRFAVEGSLVLRLYVALVYMREGVLADLIHNSATAGGECSAQVRRLLNSDYVRRIRNALSHGTFSACIAGIAFRDEHGTVVATPGFLGWLCTSLTLIQLKALVASAARLHVA